MSRIANAFGKLNCRRRACAVLILCAATPLALHGQMFTSLHSFDGGDGELPFSGLVQATDGDFYGTTYAGGAFNGGTVFRMTPSGSLTTLYNFCAQSGCTDGQYPNGTLVQDTDGNLYGTTLAGGTDCVPPNACGTVFKITLSGVQTTLYDFCAQTNCTDGSIPNGGLVQAANGDFYGTTYDGGINVGSDGFGAGTVFKISPTGSLTTLYNFCSQANCADGEYPQAGLIQATNGDFYGVTSGATRHYGSVFRITPDGTFTALHYFCAQSGCPDGANPYGGLVQAASGDLYGTTVAGGANNFGTVFRIAPSGTLTTLYSFCSQSGCPDGTQPVAALVQATDGNFYGTTEFGGANCVQDFGCGTLFKITAVGILTTLHNFCAQNGCTDGSSPEAPLIQATNGDFYGAAAAGGVDNDGTVFKLSAGLGPFVETRPTSGEAGSAVEILGSDLTGATSVTFGGTAAAFTVVSRFLITATVPAGASTGEIRVVTPSRTFSSNLPFRVP